MYLYRTRCRWEMEISNHDERMEDDGGASVTIVDLIRTCIIIVWLLYDSCMQT
jgi:hypothetical protein